MGRETERKFLAAELPFSLSGYERLDICQAYVSKDPVIRIRRENGAYYLTVKGAGLLSREEFELGLTREQFERLALKAETGFIEKTRSLIPLENGLVAELDVYAGALSGLKTVEVEFESEEAAERFAAPLWFGREITFDSAYKNVNLAVRGKP